MNGKYFVGDPLTHLCNQSNIRLSTALVLSTCEQAGLRLAAKMLEKVTVDYNLVGALATARRHGRGACSSRFDPLRSVTRRASSTQMYCHARPGFKFRSGQMLRIFMVWCENRLSTLGTGGCCTVDVCNIRGVTSDGNQEGS